MWFFAVPVAMRAAVRKRGEGGERGGNMFDDENLTPELTTLTSQLSMNYLTCLLSDNCECI